MADIELNASEAEIEVWALVRNAQGQPQFDDFNNIPKQVRNVLTEEDWQYIKEQQDGNNA